MSGHAHSPFPGQTEEGSRGVTGYAFPQERRIGSGQVLLPKRYENSRGFQRLWGFGVAGKN